ncbi:MAG: hypothetical protein V7785_07650 [Bermanella sp.]
MFSIIDQQLKQSEYINFNDFSQAVLKQDKSDSLKAVLTLGMRTSSIGQSFALGYRCALQLLLPELDSAQWAALCVSEAQGNHPRQIQTTVDDLGIVCGKKSFVSMAEQAKQLIIIAKAGEIDGRPLLKAVLVSQDNENVCFKPMPDIGMLPEVSHGTIELSHAQGMVLSGDGHVDFSKRFRYIEDLHVLMAFTSLILSKSTRSQLEPRIIEKSILLISAILSQKPQDSYWQHLHISALFGEFEILVGLFEKGFQSLSNNFTESWYRDKKVFLIASKARLARTEKARAWLADSI